MTNRGQSERVLILAPKGRDAAVIGAMLGEVGIASASFPDLPAFIDGLQEPDAGTAVLAQEAMATETEALEAWIAAQPPWSDFPFVLLTFRKPILQPESSHTTRVAEVLGNASVLERPLHPLTLVSAVRAALRARRRQRESEAFLVEREQVAAALRASEAKFRAIAEGMPQPIWSARADGTHDYFNARWHGFTGVAPVYSGVPDAPDWMPWANLLHPDDRGQLETAWRAVLDNGDAFRLRTVVGDYRWVLGRALPVHDDETGERVRWFGSCTDIDDAVRARETLASSRADLERLVDERTVESSA